MSEVKRYYIGVFGGEAQARVCLQGIKGLIRDSEGKHFSLAEDFDRVTAERDALQQRLTAADERVDVLEAENRRLRSDDLFYDAACEAMEGHHKERAKLGKEIGCQGSLIDGIAWIYQRLAELEKSPSGYTKQHHPVEFGPSDSRRIGCSCGHPDPNHEAARP